MGLHSKNYQDIPESRSICTNYPVFEGFDVNAVIGASGAVSFLECEATIAIIAQAGAKVRNWWSIGAELQADWRMDEAK